MITVFKRSACLRIYIASSFKNQLLATVAAAVGEAGHEAFAWWEGDGTPEKLFPHPTETFAANYVLALYGSAAVSKFNLDKAALDECDVGVLLLPAGASAHAEAVYLRYGLGKPVLTYLGEGFKPDLMHRLFDNGFVSSVPDLLSALAYGVVPGNAEKTGNRTSLALDPFPGPWPRYA